MKYGCQIRAETPEIRDGIAHRWLSHAVSRSELFFSRSPSQRRSTGPVRRVYPPPPMNGKYELRIAYDPSTKLGDADVRSYHEQLHDAAEAFATCTAPYKQLLWLEDGVPDELDEQEQAYVERVCREHGLEVDDVEGDGA